MKQRLFLKGEDILEVKGNDIDGVDIILKDGTTIHLDCGDHEQFIIKFNE